MNFDEGNRRNVSVIPLTGTSRSSEEAIMRAEKGMVNRKSPRPLPMQSLRRVGSFRIHHRVKGPRGVGRNGARCAAAEEKAKKEGQGAGSEGKEQLLFPERTLMPERESHFAVAR